MHFCGLGLFIQTDWFWFREASLYEPSLSILFYSTVTLADLVAMCVVAAVFATVAKFQSFTIVDKFQKCTYCRSLIKSNYII